MTASAGSTQENSDAKGSVKDVIGKPKARSGKVRRKRVRRRIAMFAVMTDWAVSVLLRAQPVVLVSGAMRSGTTWLQECLAESLHAKSVLEPLSSNSPRRKRVLRRAGIKKFGIREALIPPQAGPDDPLWKFLDPAFRANVGDFFTVRNRKNVRHSFRRHIVVKEVRLQYNLLGVHERYGIPIIHIRRHPAAVISSFMQSGWKWDFGEVRLDQVLPYSIAVKLREYDSDAISRMSAYWAVTERFVDETIAGQAWARTVSYEDLVADPARMITDLCTFIGLEQHRVPNFQLPSISTVDFSRLSNSEAQTQGWRTTLPEKDLERIRIVVGQLFPEFIFD